MAISKVHILLGLAFGFVLYSCPVQATKPASPHVKLQWDQSWCWMDASLQCFFKTKELTEKLLNPKFDPASIRVSEPLGRAGVLGQLRWHRKKGKEEQERLGKYNEISIEAQGCRKKIQEIYEKINIQEEMSKPCKPLSTNKAFLDISNDLNLLINEFAESFRDENLQLLCGDQRAHLSVDNLKKFVTVLCAHKYLWLGSFDNVFKLLEELKDAVNLLSKAKKVEKEKRPMEEAMQNLENNNRFFPWDRKYGMENKRSYLLRDLPQREKDEEKKNCENTLKSYATLLKEASKVKPGGTLDPKDFYKMIINLPELKKRGTVEGAADSAPLFCLAFIQSLQVSSLVGEDDLEFGLFNPVESMDFLKARRDWLAKFLVVQPFNTAVKEQIDFWLKGNGTWICPAGRKYTVYAMVVKTPGHFRAYGKDWGTGKWYLYDDNAGKAVEADQEIMEKLLTTGKENSPEKGYTGILEVLFLRRDDGQEEKVDIAVKGDVTEKILKFTRALQELKTKLVELSKQMVAVKKSLDGEKGGKKPGWVVRLGKVTWEQ